VKGENIPEPGIPESFKVLIKEMQSLGLDVKVLSEDNEEIEIRESTEIDGLPSIDSIIETGPEFIDESELFDDFKLSDDLENYADDEDDTDNDDEDFSEEF
jgi:DNA-directed RNA polymerase subunit beta